MIRADEVLAPHPACGGIPGAAHIVGALEGHSRPDAAGAGPAALLTECAVSRRPGRAAGGAAYPPARPPANTAAADALIDRITSAVVPGTWDKRVLNRTPGKFGAVRILSGQLILTQTQSNHRQVVYRLAMLRWQRDLLLFGWRAL